MKQKCFLQFKQLQSLSGRAFRGASATLQCGHDEIGCLIRASHFPQARCIVPADHKIFAHAGNSIEQTLVKFGGFPVMQIVQELLSDTCQQRAVVPRQIAGALEGAIGLAEPVK